MSAAEKYARPVESISAESLSQARAAGQALADKGVSQATSQGSAGAPAPTPAVKYGGANDSLQRELPPPSRSR
jgi:hypothetical protein